MVPSCLTKVFLFSVHVGRQGRMSLVDELSQYNQRCLNSDTVTDRKAWTHGRAIPPDIWGSFCTQCHLCHKIVIIGFQIRATVVNPSCHLDWFGKWLSRACFLTVLGGVPGTAGRTVLVSRLVLQASRWKRGHRINVSVRYSDDTTRVVVSGQCTGQFIRSYNSGFNQKCLSDMACQVRYNSFKKSNPWKIGYRNDYR